MTDYIKSRNNVAVRYFQAQESFQRYNQTSHNRIHIHVHVFSLFSQFRLNKRFRRTVHSDRKYENIKFVVKACVQIRTRIF